MTSIPQSPPPHTPPAQLAASHGTLEMAVTHAINALEVGVSADRVLTDLRASRERAAAMRAGAILGGRDAHG